ncbi:hypothetical protein HAX54_021845 [Datura stramonium]|uniref:Uncharacterized protein n=1 Tax=Datura stramonium TaxID=4076 RepID=A0ABS8UU43_DATST|nr:hypothetical protein [Datura stramonium]
MSSLDYSIRSWTTIVKVDFKTKGPDPLSIVSGSLVDVVGDDRLRFDTTFPLNTLTLFQGVGESKGDPRLGEGKEASSILLELLTLDSSSVIREEEQQQGMGISQKGF